MSFRYTLQKNNRAALSIAAVIMLAAVGLLYLRLRPEKPEALPPAGELGFFYDLNTRKLFVDERSREVPFETDSGPHRGEPAGVRATVLACGDPSRQSNRFIGWIETIRREGSDQFVMIRRPEDATWYELSNPKAQEIIRSAERRCGRKGAVYVWPP